MTQALLIAAVLATFVPLQAGKKSGDLDPPRNGQKIRVVASFRVKPDARDDQEVTGKNGRVLRKFANIDAVAYEV